MQPRTLDQILSEYNTIYQPQIDYLRQRQAEAPKMVEADIAAANAAQGQAYEDILTGARRRGLGFAGIPLGEQAKYSSTVYAPAILAARQKGTEFAQGLEGTILGLQAEARQKAIERQQYDEQFRENVRQFNETLAANRAAAAASRWSPTIDTTGGGGGGGATDNPYLPKKVYTKEAGYQFTDAYGTPITAAKYNQMMQMQFGGGQTYRQLLQEMANNGDKNAQIALNYVGDDYRFGGAPEQYKASLEAVGATGTYAKKPGPNQGPIRGWKSTGKSKPAQSPTTIPNYGWRSTKK